MEFVFDPNDYDATIPGEISDYDGLQRHIAEAGAVVRAHAILDLGIGTGVTALRALQHHDGAVLVGFDSGEAMLRRAAQRLPDAQLVTGRLQDTLPPGPFDLIISALAVHHLDGPEKAELFRRVAGALAPGGRFVLGDLVVPVDPADIVTPIDGVVDTPSSVDDQLAWLREASLDAHVHWADRDLAVLTATRG